MAKCQGCGVELGYTPANDDTAACSTACWLKATVLKYPRSLEALATHTWEEITLERYDDLLGCVPPRRHKAGVFAVGEAYCSLDEGGEVYRMCVRLGERYFTKLCLLESFDPDAYRQQIANQLDGWPTLASAKLTAIALSRRYGDRVVTLYKMTEGERHVSYAHRFEPPQAFRDGAYTFEPMASFKDGREENA